MKRLLFIILLFGVCLTFNRAHAQRCLPGMRGIQLTGGLSDNMRWKNGDGFGYHAGIAVITYTKNATIGRSCGILGVSGTATGTASIRRASSRARAAIT
mgnify:CR=1 FL=1